MGSIPLWLGEKTGRVGGGIQLRDRGGMGEGDVELTWPLRQAVT